MSLVFDGRALCRRPLTGIGVFAHDLFTRLLPLEPLIFSSNVNATSPLSFPKTLHVRMPSKLLNLGYTANIGPTLESLITNRTNVTVDTIFAPNIGFFNLEKRTKFIITAHDLSFHHFPEWYPPKMRAWHHAVNPTKIYERAQTIVCVSNTTARDLIETFNIPESKIKIIYPGVTIPETIIPLPQLPAKYILTLSSIEPRKNIEILIPVWRTILKKFPDLHVIMAGPLGYRGANTLKQLKNSLPVDRFHYFGFVNEPIKHTLLKNALCTVYPSLFEGFGFPPLESALHGTPALVSQTPALQETLGNTGLFAHPHRADEWINLLETITTNDQFRTHHAREQHARALTFTPEKTASLYRDLLV